MKKNFLKIAALVCCIGFLLTGCTVLSDIFIQGGEKDGQKVYFDSPEYFQGQVVKAGDWLFYGNAYANITSSDFNYDTAKESAYMARLNLLDFAFDEDVKDVNYKHSSPQGIEKVSDRLTGYVNQDMYAYGEYIYFTSANIHKTADMKNDYSMVSLFRIKFNGSGLEEFGSTYNYDAKSSITLQEGSDGNYYFVIVSPTEKEEGDTSSTTTYDVYSIKIGDTLGKENKIVSEATSVAVADANSEEKTVVAAYDPESERLTCAVKAVDFATGKEVAVYDSGIEQAITFIDRVGDIALYSYKNEVYYKNVTAKGTFVPSLGQLFYSPSGGSISNVHKAGEGYVFKGTNKFLYKSSLNAQAQEIVGASDYSNLLFVDGEYIYFSSASEIARIAVDGFAVEKIVNGMKIISGECGYDGDYIYFYATRGALELEEGQEQPTDSNSYLYQTDKNGNIQLLSLVKAE